MFLYRDLNTCSPTHHITNPDSLLKIAGSPKTEKDACVKQDSSEVKTPVKEEVKEAKYTYKPKPEPHDDNTHNIKLDAISSLTSLSEQIRDSAELTSQPLPAAGALTHASDVSDAHHSDQSGREALTHNSVTSSVGLPTPESSPGSLASPPFPASLVSAVTPENSFFQMESLVPQFYYKNFGSSYSAPSTASEYPYYLPPNPATIEPTPSCVKYDEKQSYEKLQRANA